MRVDVIWPGLLWKEGDKVITNGDAQLYPSCAQIQVESEVVGSLPKGIKIPEDLCKNCSGKESDTLFGSSPVLILTSRNASFAGTI